MRPSRIVRGRMAAVVLSLAIVASVAVTQRGTSAESPSPLLFRAVVPGLAADIEAPATSATDQVVATHLSQRVDGGLVVSGEVVNGSADSITNVEVEIQLARSGLVTSKQTGSLVNVIAPGGRGPFQLTFPAVTQTDGVLSAHVIGFERAAGAPATAQISIAGPYLFQIGPPDLKTREIPYSNRLRQLRGTVTNTSSSRLTQLEVILAAYDGDGNVAFMTTATEPIVPF